MKKILLLITSLLIITSTVFPQSTVNINSLQEYGEKAFKVDDEKPYTGRVFDLYKSTGEKKLEGRYKDGLRNGKWSWWSEDGEMDNSGTYKIGIKDGKWIHSTDIGNGKYEVRYTTGNIDLVTFTDNLGQTYSGILIQDYDEATRVDGQYLYQSWAYDFSIYPEIFATIKNGKKDGLWAQWSQDGEKTIELVYKDDKKWNGKWTEWYSNGQKRIEGSYKDGERTDTWKSWDSLGVFHSASDWFDKGYNAVENKEYDKAIPFYLRAIELKPDYAKAYNNLGSAYDDQGNYTKAIQSYEKAIELDPDYAAAYYNLGIAYNTQGNLTKAIQSYEKVIELDPDDADAYYNLGIAYNTQGNLTKAIESYDKAIELKPDYAGAYWNRSIAKDSLGDKSGGMEDTKKAARLGHKGAQDWLKNNGYEW